MNEALITGVVLCGGESRRMGSDKGLLQHGPHTWSEIACAKLEAAELPAVLSVRAAQQAEYARRFPDRRLIIDDLILPGPLGALLSVFAAVKSFSDRTSLCVLATDMPCISTNTLTYLLNQYLVTTPMQNKQKEERTGGVCFGDDRRIEPLCAIYAADALETLTDQARSLTRYNLQQLRELMNLRVISPTRAQQTELSNINSPDEYKKVEHLLSDSTELRDPAGS